MPVCPQQTRHPIRCLSHEIAGLLHAGVFRNFDDELIMDVSNDEASPEVLHCKAQNVPGNTLNDVLDELRTVAFNPGPMLLIDSHVGDTVIPELILADPGLHVREPPST